MLMEYALKKMPIPLALIQPLFSHIVQYVATSKPELFARLGVHTNSVYIIEPTNLPFILKLIPNPQKPILKLHHKNEGIKSDAHISGTFINLLKMIDGSLDGDALFFTRDLKIEGNTEAIVCLRNALDDLDGSIVDDITAAFGPLQQPLSILMRIVRKKA